MSRQYNLIWRDNDSFVVKTVDGYQYHTIKGKYIYIHDIYMHGLCARMEGAYDLPGADDAMAAVMMDAMK